MRLTKYQGENYSYKYINTKRDTPFWDIPILEKLGQLEDIEERLLKYKDVGINGLIDLFKNLTDEDIEYIVQLAFKKRKIIYEINDKR